MSISTIPTFDLEESLAREGHSVIVGFDEVGRGSLAGPVMVGAAAFLARRLPQAAREMPQYLADSKILTERRREALYEPLQQWADAWAVGAASSAEIDEWGISHALGIAALRALDAVERTLFGAFADAAGDTTDAMPAAQSGGGFRAQGSIPTSGSQQATLAADWDALDPTARMPRVGAILDGPNDYITKALGTFEAPAVPVPAHVVTQVKGDQHCGSVACAAVLAKVTRDRLMTRLAESDPDYARYGWAHNKGYGSQAHRAAIAQYGPCDEHRTSWKLL
ncbi:ribonuclease HII [Bifidobacterium pseudolongum subsp. globosum]|uniref:Ribonuclease n=1 Tax=Bifidobacterium pseudolongum subsp. globosum TaxID=1690 RepID=A0A4Q5A4K5_9BIFI|nr:ribonuclease HII [Bifidobacterium pseudolongum]RYQ12193.1 ribonuclease HII [Bifidobacterium pseudolongum subsp. globosum]